MVRVGGGLLYYCCEVYADRKNVTQTKHTIGVVTQGDLVIIKVVFMN